MTTEMSPAPSPINPAEIKAIALKVKQRLSARLATHSAAEADRCVNPLATPVRGTRRLSVERTASGSSGPSSTKTVHSSASTSEMGAPRPTRLPVATAICTDEDPCSSVRQSKTWSEEFDVDDGTTPAPHLSPRSRECTAELVLAPATLDDSATTSSTERRVRSLELGPWSGTPGSSMREYPPGRPALCNLQKSLLLVPADTDSPEMDPPPAPRGPVPANDFLQEETRVDACSPAMESVRLSYESIEGAETRVDWRDLPAAVSVMAAGSPDTIQACAKIPIPGHMRPAHTEYRFRVQVGDHILIIQTRYRHMHRLSRRLDSFITTTQSDVVLPALPPKLRGSARLSAAVVSQRQHAFREYIEAAVAAVVAAQQTLQNPTAQALAASQGGRSKMRKPRKVKNKVSDTERASAVLRRFLIESAIGTEEYMYDSSFRFNDADKTGGVHKLGTALRPVPAEQAGGGPLNHFCGGRGDCTDNRRRLANVAAVLASAIIAGTTTSTKSSAPGTIQDTTGQESDCYSEDSADDCI